MPRANTVLLDLLILAFDDGLVGDYCGQVFKARGRTRYLYDVAYQTGICYRTNR